MKKTIKKSLKMTEVQEQEIAKAVQKINENKKETDLKESFNNFISVAGYEKALKINKWK